MKQYIFVALLLPGAVHGMLKRDSVTRERAEALLHIKQVMTAGRYVYGNHIEIGRDFIRRSSSILKTCPHTLLCDGKDERRLLLANQLQEWSQLMGAVKELSSVTEVHELGFDAKALERQLLNAQVSLETWITLLKTDRPTDLSAFKSVMRNAWEKAEAHKKNAMQAQESFERSNKLSAKLQVAPVFTLLCLELP